MADALLYHCLLMPCVHVVDKHTCGTLLKTSRHLPVTDMQGLDVMPASLLQV